MWGENKIWKESEATSTRFAKLLLANMGVDDRALSKDGIDIRIVIRFSSVTHALLVLKNNSPLAFRDSNCTLAKDLRQRCLGGSLGAYRLEAFQGQVPFGLGVACTTAPLGSLPTDWEYAVSEHRFGIWRCIHWTGSLERGSLQSWNLVKSLVI